MNKLFLISGGVYGMLSVAIGAFGAHAFKSMLAASERTETYETAVKYQFYHALLLLFIGWIHYHNPSKWLSYSGWSAIIGTAIFSGALYLICFTGVKAFGAIAPIGGTLLVASWALLTLHFIKSL